VTLEAVVIKQKVQFAYNKADIKAESNELLKHVAQTILAFPRIKKVEIQGHTDHAGSEKYNKDLSSRRAKSVMDFLIREGVEAERLTSKGYGFDKPLVPLPADGKETPEGAEANRRVEFQITEQEEVKKTVREDQIPDDAKVVDPNAKPADTPSE
jgi:outer membrane protein OmpA-like peptidoglycan-associated protein